MSIEPVETMNNLSQEQHRKILSLQHRNYVVLSTYPKLDGTYFTNQHASDLSVILFAWTNIAEHLDSEKYLATDATIAAEVAADTVVTIAANAANTANTAAIASSIAYNAEWAYVWKMYSKHLFIELEKLHGKVKATEFDTIVKFVEEK